MSEPAKSKIFISYRRADSATICGRIYDRLEARFGRDAVFKDVDSIPPGVDFAAYIDTFLRQCAVQLVVIGPAWLDIQSADGTRRLDHPDDLVRQEIEGALALGVHIIPIVALNATIPPAERLPESLRWLTRINSLPVRDDPEFNGDMRRVLAALDPLIGNLSPPPPAQGDQVDQLQTRIAASFAADDWPDVERGAEWLIRQAPRDATAQVYYMYASALVKLNRPQEALPQLRTALALVSDQSERLSILGTYAEVAASLGGWADVLSTSEEALRLAPDDSRWLEWKLRALTELKRLSEALRIAHHLTADPEATAVQWLARARLEVDQTLYEDAERSLATAQRLAPHDAAVAQARVELFPAPDLPRRLAELGFRGVNIAGVPMILPPVVPVPGGEFLMGSDRRRDREAANEEKPQHRVILPAFQIGKFPVTVAEYACFVLAGHGQPQNWQSQLAKPYHPAVNISWHDAMAYAGWLAKLTGQPWRLPTEAEWEKAARGTDGRLYPWGDRWDKSRANTSDGGPGATTLVGQYPSGASPYGALEMTGNVWEWTSTLFKPYPYSQNDGREDLNSSENRVLRGGSWYVHPMDARAACRIKLDPDYFGGDGGFRLLLAVPAS